jgi:small-conductance mechanosensitive channel
LEILQNEVAGNRLLEWLQALGVFVSLWLGLWLLRRSLLRLLRSRLEAAGNDFLPTQLSKLGLPVFLPLSLIIACRLLKPMPELHTWLYYALVAGIAFRTVRFAQAAIQFGLDHAMSSAQGERKSELATLRSLTWIVGALLWFLAAVFVLANAGVNVSGALAGLGIGGIAVALSAQKILGDLFASISLILDKPFHVGDLIGSGDVQGTVERIGLRSTRIRSVSGELAILPNSLLASAKISNFSQATRSRLALSFTLPLSTPPALRRAFPALAAEALQGVPHAQLEAAQLSRSGESSLEFSVSFFVPANEPACSNAAHEANLAILERLERAGIGFGPQVPVLELSKEAADLLKR